MIHVDRDQDIGRQAVRPNQEWFDKSLVLRDQAISDGPDHEVDGHYKDSEVKKALEKLFNGKCAYCEGPILPQGPWEVEHYRPKGRVRENQAHPGYYWLAYDWENLFPSCKYCNGHYKDHPTFDDPHTSPASGKYDQFPLVDETLRAMTPNDPLELESPKLLNPCKDEDCESFLRYDILGHILPEENDVDERAAETIRICNLDRKRLRTPRANVITKMIKTIKAHEKALTVGDHDLTAMILDILESFKDDKSEFAGTARYVDRNRHAFIA